MSNMPKQGYVSPERVASTPYNFVPLPESVVSAVMNADALPGHNRYDPDRHTGHFVVRLTTRSPLYVRGMLTSQEFTWDKTGRNLNGVEVSRDNPGAYADRPKNKPDFFFTRDPNKPAIPGSSLRGMLRSVLEIVSYSKPQEPSDKPKVFIRAVTRDEPLGERYTDVMGVLQSQIRAGEAVKAGYLFKHGRNRDEWRIRPAKTITEGKTDYPFLIVRETNVTGFVPALHMLGDPNYRPTFHEVCFATGYQLIGTRNAFVGTQAQPRGNKLPYNGMLVCSGDMTETGATSSPRHWHTLVFEPDTSIASGKCPKLSLKAIDDYKTALTTWQKEKLNRSDPENGCLIDDRPVFYIEPYSGESEVRFFGHSPNFRIPGGEVLSDPDNPRSAWRATTPHDFLPREICRPEQIDFADALFGFVRTKSELKDMEKRKIPIPQQGKPGRAYASRVFVTQANLEPDQTNLWLVPEPPHTLTPQILATPKPECFQHYLVQPSDQKAALKHYGSLSDPQSGPPQTVIRGHKRYWHQGPRRVDHLTPQADSPQMDDRTGQPNVDSTQHTLIQPLREDITFTFRVHFENLTLAELGALCWTLHPQGQEHQQYLHSLGMGKPLGMGAVELNAVLIQTFRRTRYKSLFSSEGNAWETGESATQESEEREVVSSQELWGSAVAAFDAQVRAALSEEAAGASCLADIPRIQALLRLMEWPGFPPESYVAYGNRYLFGAQPPRPNTRPMQISPDNEFKERYVLPAPEQFVRDI